MLAGWGNSGYRRTLKSRENGGIRLSGKSVDAEFERRCH